MHVYYSAAEKPIGWLCLAQPLLMIAAFSLAGLLLELLSPLPGLSSQGRIAGFVISGVGVLVGIYAEWTWRKADLPELILSEAGLQHSALSAYSPQGRQVLPWDSVQGLEWHTEKPQQVRLIFSQMNGPEGLQSLACYEAKADQGLLTLSLGGLTAAPREIVERMQGYLPASTTTTAHAAQVGA